jgi:L-lactate dehydrogenase complex protein LldF
VCPVYERTGGHAYGSVYPGPIGAVLSPQLTGMRHDATLPFASTLCGACYDVCPVAIDIPSMLVHLRGRAVEARAVSAAENVLMGGVAALMRRPRRWATTLKLARLGRVLGRRRGQIGRLPPPLSAWTDTRDLPRPPRRTFREWWSTDATDRS